MSADDTVGLTSTEAAAIRRLQRVAKTWPRSLTLASMDGALMVLRTGDYLPPDGSVDDAAVVADVTGIPNTGGGW